MGSLVSLFTSSRHVVRLLAVLCGALCMQACQLGTPVQDGGTGGSSTGGSATGGGGTGGSPVECEALDEAACYGASCWKYIGYPVRTDCYDKASPTFVGCGAGGGCVGMTRSGTDENGDTWDFPNGCAPDWADGFSPRYECGIGGEGGGP